MKRPMTRRRSALCWSALAVALVLLWGVATGYGFTPEQARQRWWKLGGRTPEEVVLDIGKVLHPYTEVYGGPDYTRYTLCADEEQMELMREAFSLFGGGWTAWAYDRMALTEENAAVFPELKIWAGNCLTGVDNGYVYFRVKDMTGDVVGFRAVQGRKQCDGTVVYREIVWDNDIGFTANGEYSKTAGRLDRGQLSGDGHGNYYGAVVYYPKSPFYSDYKYYYQWYLQIALADGRYLYVECKE